MTSGAAPPPPHPDHGVAELCAAGAKLCTRARRTGHIRADEAADAPCLGARLSATLGSGCRARLGHLIGRSGIPGQEG